MSAATLLVIAKEPVAGQVKTRLCPPYSPEQAAQLAAAALADTLAAVVGLCARRPEVRPVVVLDGAPGPWLPVGVEVRPQPTGTFDRRLAAAFDGADRTVPALLIGMDTPQVDAGLLGRALDTLDDHDACLGLAADGGWWALGLRRPVGGLLRGIPTSTTRTGILQRGRLDAAGLTVADLPVLRDVDTAADAAAVAALAPTGRFARIVETSAPARGAA